MEIEKQRLEELVRVREQDWPWPVPTGFRGRLGHNWAPKVILNLLEISTEEPGQPRSSSESAMS
jgi:hypothetical protein